MNIPGANTYRKELYKDWAPLLSFGSGISSDDRYGHDGWLGFPYNAPKARTMGLRYKDPTGNVVAHKVAFRSSYDTYDSQAGYTMAVKYDPAKLTTIWYRYRMVDGILLPFTELPELRVLSLREHVTHFGHLDLSPCAKFSHLDISTHWSKESFSGGSCDQITFHPDAPLKFVYLSGCVIPTSVVDACLTQCYNHRDTPAPEGIQDSRSFQSQRVSWSAGLQYMVDELKNNYGWGGFGFY